MDLLSTLETYYDAAPRPLATTEEVGPFTLFLRAGKDGWPYYARPSLEYDGPFTSTHVETVQERQRELEVPQSLEWVHETTPTLLVAAREAGMHVTECPLLVLPGGADTVTPPIPDGYCVRMLSPDSPDISAVVAAVSAGFSETDDVEERAAGRLPGLLGSGLLAMAGAYDGHGPVGGGSHSPRGTSTELTGIAVVPRARRKGIGAAITAALVSDARTQGITTVFLSAHDDAVARVYERIGFQRVGTACIAEPSDT